jgi:SpoVK/Ycf46/Vps4 family AAA+-type ATPase/energy-coupling factor transporter ATP-binding protein EcfA2
VPRRLTKEIRSVRLPERRIREIEDLVASWPYETKAFMRARLHQYTPPSGLVNAALEGLVALFSQPRRRRFAILRDPLILTDWQRRFEHSGETTPREAWNRMLEKEVTRADYDYLLWLLDRELSDVHVPWQLRNLFEKVYRAHVRKEYLVDPEVPKAPLLLVVGPSGSGKTATVGQAFEAVIFRNEVRPEVDLKQKKEELLAGEPFWKTIESVDPTLAAEIARRRRLRFYQALSRTPLLRRLFQKRIGRHLAELQERGVVVDYAVITPNDYQTALAGEPGNFLRKALGDPRRPSIRHVEEAHSAFARAEGRQSALESQQQTLVDTANIVLDEIIQGRRDCLLVATSDQAERFDAAIYRRFLEKGRIIDIAEFWQHPENLREIVRLELLRADIRIGTTPRDGAVTGVAHLTPAALEAAVEKLFPLFRNRALNLTPSYVRKLVHSILEMRGEFRPELLDDSLLVRTAFEQVARNAYGDLYKRVVDKMDRQVGWEDYVGSIKDLFSEMANNCLYYGVNDEKGVVLSGPPGSGKTFLARVWLSENKDVHDIAVRPSDLQDPSNPIDGTVQKIEQVYDIAKMIAPAVVFIDEGDALVPRRSAAGGAPQDKLTNKFLNLVDGEIPLNRVFTVLTTNRLDILDPALVRSKRLKTLEVSGHLREDDITGIVARKLEEVPLAAGLTVARLVEAAKGVCNTPADYAAFAEKASALRSTECEVILRLRALKDAPPEARENFIKFNLRTLLGILDALEAPQTVRARLRAQPMEFLGHYEAILGLVDLIGCGDDYPLTLSHLQAARQEVSQSPVKKGKIQLDEFLQAELSQEPQVGFIIGVGANEVTGVLLPIATSLTYNISPDKVLVTGAVSSTAPNAAEMDMAVQMTQQSAREAFTLVENYLQGLTPKVNVPRVLGEFLDKYTIHHQLLSASYAVGGPSAGYALALNTLSALLLIPVQNDFGITGAPWTKGVKRGEVGSPVIIGGHKRKAETVLRHLRRMFMPLQNYKDLEPEFLAAYWSQGKDILGVSHFGDLVPEVMWLGAAYEEELVRLIALRIDYKSRKHRGERPPGELKEKILEGKSRLRDTLEEELIRRIEAIREYLQSPDPDPHLSLEEIFRKGRRRRLWGLDRLRPRWKREEAEIRDG